MPVASLVPIPIMLFTVVNQLAADLPVTVYPPDLNTVVFDVRPWHCVHEVVTSVLVTVFGAVYVHDCDRTGVPVQPAGLEVSMVLV